MYDGKSKEGYLAFLEGKKLLKLDHAHMVLETQVFNKQGVVKTILELGLLPEETVADSLTEYLGLEPLSPGHLDDTLLTGKDFSPRYLRQKSVLPISSEGRVLTLAMLDPLDLETIRMISTATGMQVVPCTVTQSDLRIMMDQRLPENGNPSKNQGDSASQANDKDPTAIQTDDNSPASNFIDGLITKAVKLGASDIHIGHSKGKLEVRFRIDGHLESQKFLVSLTPETLISRLKVQAGMDIAEKRLPQDGRARVIIGGREIDLRFASLPTQNGETITIRLLNQSRAPLNLSELGFSDQAIARLRQLLSEPNGLILVTGPTGSGKTTTLYAALNEKVDGTKKIMSIEDPVEYDLQGVTQVAIKPSIGLTFPKVLRSVMRHDPDIILVGEIRDQETAEIAIRAALTGHLVLATLHTNSAADAVTRLVDMGIPRYLITASVRGAVAQRLVRRLNTSSDNKKSYSGRAVIAEVLMLEQSIKQLVLDGAAAEDIFNMAEHAGMQSMTKDGLQKMHAGITTAEEISRVAIDLDRVLGVAS